MLQVVVFGDKFFLGENLEKPLFMFRDLTVRVMTYNKFDDVFQHQKYFPSWFTLRDFDPIVSGRNHNNDQFSWAFPQTLFLAAKFRGTCRVYRFSNPVQLKPRPLLPTSVVRKPRRLLSAGNRAHLVIRNMTATVAWKIVI